MTLKSFLGSSMVYALIEGMQKGVLFLLMPLMTFYITPNEYGLISTALMIISFLSVVLTMSLHGAISRYYYSYKGDIQRAFLSSVFVFLTGFLCVSLVIILLVSPQVFNEFFPEIKHNPYVIYIVVISCTQPMISLILSLLKIKQDIKVYSILSVVYFTMKIVLFVVFIFIFHLQSDGYLLSLLVANIALTSICIVYVAKNIGLYFDFRFIKRALKYSLPILPVDLLNLINNLIDRTYILTFIGLASVGIYYLGLQLSGILLMLLHAVNSAFIPFFYKITNEKTDDYSSLYFMGDVFVVFSCCISVFVAIFGAYIIENFFDVKYHDVIQILPILSLNAGLTSIYILNTNLLSLKRKLVRIKTYIILCGAGINCLLSWQLTQNYGLVGAALSTLISNAIIIFLFIIVVRNKTKFKYNNNVHLLIVLFGVFFVSIINDVDILYVDFFSYFVFVALMVAYSYRRYLKCSEVTW